MPESRVRKTAAYTAPTGKAAPPKPSPRWYAPVMVGLMILGLLWIVTFYITQQAYPVPNIGYYNLLIGFGILLVGFAMTTRWR